MDYVFEQLWRTRRRRRMLKSQFIIIDFLYGDEFPALNSPLKHDKNIFNSGNIVLWPTQTLMKLFSSTTPHPCRWTQVVNQLACAPVYLCKVPEQLLCSSIPWQPLRQLSIQPFIENTELSPVKSRVLECLEAISIPLFRSLLQVPSEKKRQDWRSEARVVLKLPGVGFVFPLGPDGHLDESQETEQGYW